MGYSVQLLLVFVALSAYFISETEAIECFECSTMWNEECGDRFKDGTRKSSCGQCQKVKTKTDDTELIVRTCLAVGVGDNSCNTVKSAGAEVSTCRCESNLCNGSSYVSVSMVTHICIVLIVYLAKLV